MDDRTQIKGLYKRFGKFLRKHSNLLADVFILVNKRTIHDDLNFKIISGLNWKVITSFDNNGIDVEFLKLEL
jgi:hypothetical protein